MLSPNDITAGEEYNSLHREINLILKATGLSTEKVS